MNNALARIAGLMLLALLSIAPRVGLGEAHAQSYSCTTFENTTNVCATREDAYNAALAKATQGGTAYCPTFGSGYTLGTAWARPLPLTPPTTRYQAAASCKSPSGEETSNTLYTANIYSWSLECPSGEVWNEASHTCFDPSQCLAKAPVSYGLLNVSIAGMKMCQDGCEFEAQGGTSSALTTGNGDSLNTYYGGAYRPTGNMCSAGQQPPQPPKDQDCVGVPGQTMCKRADGKLCASASTGKQICWDPGETGEKGDGSLLQVRGAGALPATPQTPPPAGDTFQQQGTAQTASESINGGAPINTNFANYGTASGPNAVGSGGTATGGSGSAGEPADGSTSGDEAPTGSSDEERNGLLGTISNKLTDLKDALVGDGDPDADTTGLDAHPSDVMSDDEVGSDGFDQSGFGYARSCPAPPTVTLFDHTFTFDAEGHFCDWMVAGGWFVLIVAGIASMYIAVGGSRR